MFDPGKADQSITIQAVTISKDSAGAMTKSWSDVSGAPIWAEYIPLRGIERIEAGRVSEKTQFKLRVRRYASLTTENRVVHNSKNYDIVNIEDNHRDGDMVLFCREAVA